MNLEYERNARPFMAAFVPYILLNLADVSLTKISLDVAGAIEANPIMALLFENSFWSAALFKAAAVCLVGLIAAHLWNMRVVQRIISIATWMMATIILYQMVGIYLSV